MKTISVKQPWAYLICSGVKDIENRTWPCPKKYIGKRVLIHASAVPIEMVNPNSVFTKAQWDRFSMGFQRELICGNSIVNSAIIGSVMITDCVVNHLSVWAEKGVYNIGYFLMLYYSRNLYLQRENFLSGILMD